MTIQTRQLATCPSCGAGHEVERILIGPEGTPVRCAACGTIFPVLPEEEALMKSAVVWILRDRSGSTTPFCRLGVLQKLILEGRAAPDAELSRFGGAWQSLGDIEGLRPCFDRADRPAGSAPAAIG